jgi:L-rhamnonate dehydratase
MKIADIRAFQPTTSDDPNDWRTLVGQIAVVVETDAGLRGFGVGGGGPAGVHIIETVLRSALLGRDAGDVEGLHDEMYRRATPFGRRGISSMAISGVDLALWDLRGKSRGVPVWKLLTTSQPGRIPTYKTGWSADEVIAAG